MIENQFKSINFIPCLDLHTFSSSEHLSNMRIDDYFYASVVRSSRAVVHSGLFEMPRLIFIFCRYNLCILLLI